ncbi:MAG: acylneuraminate cytidylyltransferase family protein [Pseudomonadota bacterium]
MEKKKVNVVTIILARGGSKGLPKKNIALLDGKPLIAYAIESSLQCNYVDRTIVSTDDKDIANAAIQYGAEVPFMRPEKLSGDYANAEECLCHAVDWLAQNEDYCVDIVSYLQVTDVFKKKYMLEECIKTLLNNSKIESAFVGYRDHKNYWTKQKGKFIRLTNAANTARQIKESIYREDTGLGCATRVDILRQGKRLGDNVVIIENDDVASFVDIHTDFELWLAEQILKSGKRTIND